MVYMVVQIFLARGILFQYLLTEDDIFSYVTDILKLIFNFFPGTAVLL